MRVAELLLYLLLVMYVLQGQWRMGGRANARGAVRKGRSRRKLMRLVGRSRRKLMRLVIMMMAMMMMIMMIVVVCERVGCTGNTAHY